MSKYRQFISKLWKNEIGIPRKEKANHLRSQVVKSEAMPSNSVGVTPAQLNYALEHTRHLWEAIDRAYDQILPNLTVTCIVCDYSDRRDGFEIHVDQCIFGGGKLERYGCPSCGCIFGPQKYLDLPEAAVEVDYRFLYSYYSEADPSANEIRTFHSLQPKQHELFLDWGCGGTWSKTVATLRDDGWDVWGFEPSAPVSQNFVVSSRAEISAKFNGIFSNNVIEHFRRPVEVFREFNKLLIDGGKMAHSSPCFERSYTYTRFHTLFLTGRSPLVLAEKTGFQLVDILKDGDYISVLFSKEPGAVDIAATSSDRNASTILHNHGESGSPA